jgi:tetratricopeptide (TPR) repeat protein
MGNYFHKRQVSAINDGRMRRKQQFSRLIFFLLVLFFQGTLAAQVTDSGKDRIEIEKLVVEASREKMLGNEEKALGIYQKILERIPNDALAAYESARLHLHAQHYEEALRLAQLAVQSEPTNVWYRLLIADINQKMDKSVDAAKVYEELVKLYPTQTSYYFKWAELLQKAGEGSAAVKALDELEKRMGTNAEALRQKHAIYAALGDNKKAAKELQRLVAAFPKNIDNQYTLADFFEKIGDKAQAKSVYQSILNIDPKSARAKMALTSEVKNSATPAVNNLLSSFEDPSVNIDLKIAKLQPLLKNSSSPDQSLLDITAVLERVHPTEGKAFAISGDVYRMGGNSKSAAEKYLKALELDDAAYPVWEKLLQCYQALGDCKTLAQKCATATEIFPNKPYPYLIAGWANFLLSNYPASADWLDQALPISAKDVNLKQQILSLQALVFSAQENFTAADPLFNQALQLNPMSAITLARQAYSLSMRANSIEQALTTAQKAYELDGQSTEITQYLARAKYKNNNLAEAKTLLEPLVNKGNPLLLEHFGDVLYKLGDTNGAFLQWEQAIKNGSISAILKKKIADKKLYE